MEYGYEMITLIPIRSWSASMIGNYRTQSSTATHGLLMDSWVWLGDRLRLMIPFYFINTSFLFKYPEIGVREIELFTGLKWVESNYNSIFDPDEIRHKQLMATGFDRPHKVTVKHSRFIGSGRVDVEPFFEIKEDYDD